MPSLDVEGPASLSPGGDVTGPDPAFRRGERGFSELASSKPPSSSIEEVMIETLDGGSDFDEAFRTLLPRAVRIAYRILGDVNEAEDGPWKRSRGPPSEGGGSGACPTAMHGCFRCWPTVSNCRALWRRQQRRRRRSRRVARAGAGGP